MPIWFIFALLAPMIWAVVNHIDKYVISRYAENKKPESLVIFSALISGVAALLIYFFIPLEKISLPQELWAIIAGMLFVFGYIPYMYGLKEEEVSIVAPLYQMITPISYIIGAIFLHESLSGKQMLASGLILGGSILLTLNLKKLAWKSRVFNLMLFSCFVISLNAIIFKIIGLESSFWTVSFWEYLGALIFGLIVLSIPSYRKDFRNFVKEGGQKIVSLNVFSETLNVVGRLFFNSALLLAPVALVYAVSGTQPFFILLYGLLIYLFIPKFGKEDFTRKSLFLKFVAIILMIVGSALLFL